MRANETTADLLVLALWSAAFFCAGCSWAAYRAVGWVERWRSWAHSLTLSPSSPSDVAAVGEAAWGPRVRGDDADRPLALAGLDGMGTE